MIRTLIPCSKGSEFESLSWQNCFYISLHKSKQNVVFKKLKYFWLNKNAKKMQKHGYKVNLWARLWPVTIRIPWLGVVVLGQFQLFIWTLFFTKKSLLQLRLFGARENFVVFRKFQD